MRLALLLVSVPVWAQVTGPTPNQDRPGVDLFAFSVTTSSGSAGVGPDEVCRQACARHRSCLAYTYDRARNLCRLQRTVRPPRTDSCCLSGARIGNLPELPAPPAEAPEPFQLQTGIDRPGADYVQHDLSP